MTQRARFLSTAARLVPRPIWSPPDTLKFALREIEAKTPSQWAPPLGLAEDLPFRVRNCPRYRVCLFIRPVHLIEPLRHLLLSFLRAFVACFNLFSAPELFPNTTCKLSIFVPFYRRYSGQRKANKFLYIRIIGMDERGA
jgi:hypothetical protein